MLSRTTEVSCPPRGRRAPQNLQIRKMKNPQKSPLSQSEEVVPICDVSFLFCRPNRARLLPTLDDGVPRMLVLKILRVVRARTVAHLGRDGTRTADAEADAEFRHRSTLAWLVQIDAWAAARRACIRRHDLVGDQIGTSDWMCDGLWLAGRVRWLSRNLGACDCWQVRNYGSRGLALGSHY